MIDIIEIRKAILDDALTLAAIGYSAWEQSILPLLVERPGLRQAERRRIAMDVASSTDRIIIATCDEEAVGWCSRIRGKSYIPYLMVAPAFQGQGIGAVLLRRMESMLELEGQPRVQLETPADNVRAVRFYEKQGYHILALKADGRSAHEAFMSVRLEKRLRPYTGPIGDDD